MKPAPSPASSHVARYTLTAIALHWVLAVAILTAFCVGLYVEGLPFSPAKLKLINWHKWAGVTILFLSVLRLLWRLLCLLEGLRLRLLESLRLEQRRERIRVVTIAPGYIRTPMTEHNPYRMPFLMDADVFARKAARAIAAGRRFAVVPWQMGVVASILHLMPRWLYDAIFSRAPRKPRAQGGSQDKQP